MKVQESKCPNCGKWFEEREDGKVERHTVMRGYDLYVCAGSGKASLDTRTAYR